MKRIAVIGTSIAVLIFAGIVFAMQTQNKAQKIGAKENTLNTLVNAPQNSLENVMQGGAQRDVDAALNRIFTAIDKNQWREAEAEVDTLLRQLPKFRLAHLIKGDLLIARSRPMNAIGEASKAPPDKLNDLREEALVRLNGYRAQQSPAHVAQIPRYLLEMPKSQQFAIVVDTDKSRLYLYENKDGKTPQLVRDFYVTQGKLGADKYKEGDKRTPLGVYFVTSFIPDAKLPDLYGSGAYPISYPNELDVRQGRTGYGIWLHGVPTDTYSRAPKASDGCVALSNEDFESLEKIVQIGTTPVIISSSIEWVSPKDVQQERQVFQQKINEWKEDWESLDAERFLKNYSKTFANSEQSYAQFAEQKRKVAGNKEWIKVNLSEVSVFRNPGKDGLMVVTFSQDYQSNGLTNQMKKRQYWQQENGDWKIIYEGAA